MEVEEATAAAAGGVDALAGDAGGAAAAAAAAGDDLSEVTPEELRHSLLVFYIVILAMILAQSALVAWRRRARRSYELVTLVGLFLIPPVISVQIGAWRFVAVWALYSAVTGFFLYSLAAARAGGMDKALPKRLYRWFEGVFRASVAVGAAGYALLLAQVLGVGLAPLLDPGSALIVLWYGLYFGILTRDCAEVASDRIAARMGGARRMAVSVRDCGVCGGELRDAHSFLAAPGANGSGAAPPAGGVPADPDASVQLSCRHLFHQECARGWLIVGKKDCCPTCGEKVDARALYAAKPWLTTNLSWVQMLDMVRYMAVWQPTILVALHFVLHVFHLDEESPHRGAGGALNGTLAADAAGGAAL
jgi:RING finger protein 121